MTSLWDMYGELYPDENHYRCSIEPDGCYKWRGFKEEFDALEQRLREQIANDIANSDCKCEDHNPYCDGYNNAVKWAARYVRGKK